MEDTLDSSTQSNILIVDDVADNVFYLEVLLAHLPINIIIAYSGSEALEKIKGKELALALIDIQMPEMNGIELAHTISHDTSRDRVPIIFLTAYTNDDQQLQTCYNAGGVDFILKPFSKEILLSKIHFFIELDQKKHQLIRSQNALQKYSAELHIANQALVSSEKRYRNLIEQSLQGQLIIQDERIVLVNKAFEKLAGPSLGQVISKRRQQVRKEMITHLEGFDLHTYKAIIEGKKKFSLQEYQWTKENGEVSWIQVFSNRIEYDGRPAIHATVNDITDRKIIEEELQNIFNLSMDLVCVLDIHTLTFKKINAAFKQILGYDEAKLIGRKLIEFVHPDDRKATLSQFEAGMKNLEIVRIQNRYRCADGSYKWLSWISQLFHDTGLAYTVAHDVTELKDVENKIRESESMYRTLLQTIPEGIFILDTAGMVIEVSDITLELFDAKTKNEFYGLSVYKLLRTKEESKLREILERTVEEGLVQNVEFILSTNKNVQIFAEVTTTLIQDHEGKPSAFIVIVRDISRRKEMEQQLIHTERLAGIGEMAASLAHELNQPLVNISFSLENILAEVADSKTLADKYLEKKTKNIFENLQRMENIIDHVRAFSRGLDDSFQGLFDVNVSIRNGIMLVSEQFINHGISMKVNLEEGIPACKGNTFKFEQVIVNLLVNAKDAIVEKQKNQDIRFEKFVSVASCVKDDIILIQMKDNGCGICKENLEKIMLPFFSTKQAGIGTGLGLSISLNIIKELHGDFHVESSPEEGTTFTINLPIYHV